MTELKLTIGDNTTYVDLPEKFVDLEAGMLHVESALRGLFEKAGLIQTYADRMKELGHRPNMGRIMGNSHKRRSGEFGAL